MSSISTLLVVEPFSPLLQGDFKTGLHLILCYYATGDKDRMKKGFTQLVEIPLEVEDEDKYQPVSDDPMSNLILEAIKNDDLRKMERAKRWSESISCLVIDQ